MDLKDLPKPERTGETWWHALSRDEKSAALEAYFEAKGSNGYIAGTFHISEGSVARMRDLRNHRLYPERYDPVTGRPLPKMKEEIRPEVKKAPEQREEGKVVRLQPEKPPAPKPVAPVAAKSKPIPEPKAPKLALVESKEASKIKPAPRAEHAPGTSPTLKRLPGLQDERPGGRSSPFPDDLDPEDLRAIQGMYKD